MAFPYHDLREFMAACEEAGEMITIDKELNWNLEVGAISRRICEVGAPMAFMPKLKGYTNGVSILASPLSKGWRNDFSRVSIALGLDPDTPFRTLLREFGQRSANPVRPLQVAKGPCKQNVVTGKDIDLFRFPAPYLHEGDGGRYLNTFGVTACKDPDSGWVNWGVYRHMIHKKSILGGIVNPFQHNGMIYYQKYEPRGRNMPFTLFFGGCPSTSMVGSMQFPAGVSEADIAGGLRRAPLQLVKCETNDMLVPATAEIVIEGHVRPHERWDEGPFGEATGYRASPRMPRPVFRVDCITFRDNPVMPISCPGVDLDECEILFGVFSLTNGMEQELREAGLPIREVMSPPGLKFALLIVTVEKGHAGIADRVASAVRASKGGVFFQYIAVIDEDVDVTSLPESLHAVLTKTHPVRGIQVMALAPGHPLIPFSDLHDKMHSRGAALTFNATTPVDWDAAKDACARVSFAGSYPQDLRQRVLDQWQKYGFAA